MPTDQDLERAVFGGSDSELSSDDEDLQRKQSHGEPSRRQRREYESSGDSEDYREERKLAKRKKHRVRKADGDEGSRAAQKKRKRKPAPITEEDLNALPPEQASKIRLDMQIEAILKTKKSSRPKKRKNNDEVLDSYADDEVARLRENMITAADEDIRANEAKTPATAKLRLLPEALETLRKSALAQSIIDNNLLEAVRRWLEPLPDRSLPVLNIQREFFNIIKKMEFIDSAVLKESGLGRIVLFYTKCKRVTPDISRTANELVLTWSRPIIKKSASFRDLHIPQAEEGSAIRVERLNEILAKARESDKKRARPNAVAIPRAELGNYNIAPRSGLTKVNASVDMDIARRKKNAERLRSLTRKVANKT